MRRLENLLAFFMLATIVISCKKEKKVDECFPNAATVRTIDNKQAVVKVTGTINPVYLIEQGAIDTRLIPCNLPLEFYQNDLLVTITGDVKSTLQVGPGPCCSENFVIKTISR